MKSPSLFFLGCLFILNVVASNAQQKSFLFDNFTQGVAMMKDQSVSAARLNYNLATQEMYFYDNDNLMKLGNVQSIATIVIDGRKFIPHKNSFLEIVSGVHATLFIDWKTTVVSKGKEGAFGTVSHAFSVDNLSSANFEKLQDVTVYDFIPENTYYLSEGNKLKKFKDLKSFLKLFPQSGEQAIRDFVKAKNTDWQKPQDVLAVVDEFAK